MIKKLKIGEPIIYAYCHQAALLSVLYEYPETYPWIYSNYIQIYTLYDLWKQKDRLGTLDFYYHFMVTSIFMNIQQILGLILINCHIEWLKIDGELFWNL